MYLIGIDIGTTNTKVVLYETNGRMVAMRPATVARAGWMRS